MEPKFLALGSAIYSMIFNRGPICIICDKADYLEAIRDNYPLFDYKPYGPLDIERNDSIAKAGNVVVTTNPQVLDLFIYKNVIHAYEGIAGVISFARIRSPLINNMVQEGVPLSTLWLSSYFNQESHESVY